MKHQEMLQCKVVNHNFSPNGKVEGLLVEISGRPAQVVFPHNKGTELARTIPLGETIDLIVEPASQNGDSSHPVYRFVSVEPSEKSDGGDTPASDAILGNVARLNYTRHGEPNGVVLDQGDFIHLKPHGMRQMALKVGDGVQADGKSRSMEFGGRVVEATSVNGVELHGHQ